MKFKRSERLVLMTHHLTNHPNELIALNHFVTEFKQAKSSISEDIKIIKEIFEAEGIGSIKTTAGAGGGITFYPEIKLDKAREIVQKLMDTVKTTERLLPGGYMYMSDIIGSPSLMNDVADLIVTLYKDKTIDAVVTIATKGIPFANAVAGKLNVPIAVIRKDNKVTEGSTVSVNYVSGSSRKIETMVLSKRTLNEGSKVLVVDDFLRAGGSISGVFTLMDEFKAEVIGVSVLVEAKQVENRKLTDYVSLLKVSDIDEFNQSFQVEVGNCLERLEENKPGGI